MKNYRWLATCFALALAGVLTLADQGWAQCGGYGCGSRNRVYQAGQTGWQGRGGPRYANCPNYAGNGYGAWGNGNGQGARQGRRGGRYKYTNTQNTATPATPINQ